MLVFKKINHLPLLNVVCSLLILLWVYTAISKLVNIQDFKNQLGNQSFSINMAASLQWIIPICELIAATLLLIAKTRFLGLLLSFMMMLLFTGYITLVIVGYFDRVACSCGGVLKQMGWQAHFWFNLFFLGASGIGAYVCRPWATFSFRRRKM